MLSKVLWLLPPAGLIGFVGYGFMPQPIEVETVHPTVGSLVITVDDDGETRIREYHMLSAPVSGKLLRIDLQAGDSVVAGETEIARIQPSDPSLLDARTRQQAEAHVRVVAAIYRQANSAVQRAEEVLTLAERDLERAKKLKQSGAIAEAQYDAVENRFRLAIEDVRSAELALRVALYEIDQAEATIRDVKATHDLDDENFFTLVSPITGKVLAVHRDDSGVILLGTPIATLGDPTDLEIVVDVLSTQAVRVFQGDPARIEHWGGNEPLDGVVRVIEPSAFLKVSTLGVEEKRVNVIIDFTDPFQDRSTLGDGYRVEAKIIVDETPESSLSIPVSALFREGNGWRAYRVTDGVAELAMLKVGRSDGSMIEVVAGLEKSDRVIMYPSESIRSGVKVIEGG